MKTPAIKKIILLLLLSSIYTYGQGILKGTVRDSLTAHQLKCARIILTGTTFNAVSNIKLLPNILTGNEPALSSRAKNQANEINMLPFLSSIDIKAGL